MVLKRIYKEFLMKIVGLITEYNPFHNGHQYHIQAAKEVTGADIAVVIMSGDYVQRGTSAIMPKRLRAEMALKCGAGLLRHRKCRIICLWGGFLSRPAWDRGFPLLRKRMRRPGRNGSRGGHPSGRT